MLFFLDIDGVMVPAKGWKRPEFLEDGFPAFSNRATAALQGLLTDNDTVILTTSHKSNYSIAAWKRIFRKRGLSINKLESLAGNVDNLSRRDELVNWFRENQVNENFVIIDDDSSLNELPDLLKKNLVQPSPYVGLTEEHSAAISAILHKTSPTD